MTDRALRSEHDLARPFILYIVTVIAAIPVLAAAFTLFAIAVGIESDGYLLPSEPASLDFFLAATALSIVGALYTFFPSAAVFALVWNLLRNRCSQLMRVGVSLGLAGWLGLPFTLFVFVVLSGKVVNATIIAGALAIRPEFVLTGLAAAATGIVVWRVLIE